MMCVISIAFGVSVRV